MESDFQDILSAAREGDQRAWHQLIESCRRVLLRRSSRFYRGNYHDSQDALAAFFLYAIERRFIHKFRGSSINELRGFLGVCLHNFMLSQKVPKEVADQDAIDHTSIDPPHDSFHSQEIANAVQSAVQDLRVEYREVIVLEMQYKQREIAAMLGRPINTVSSHSRRAKRILKDRLLRHGIRCS